MAYQTPKPQERTSGHVLEISMYGNLRKTYHNTNLNEFLSESTEIIADFLKKRGGDNGGANHIEINIFEINASQNLQKG